MSHRLFALAAVVLLLGCARSRGDVAVDGGSPASSLAAAASGVPTGQFIAFPSGRPASLWWDEKGQVLYAADNEDNRVWTWKDGSEPSVLLQTGAVGDAGEPGTALVGQIVKLADGTVVVAHFGKPHGGFGGVAYASPKGTSGVLQNVDGARKHLGLALAPDGTIYGSYFVSSGDGGPPAGSVTKVDFEHGEMDYATGFGKVVGLLVVRGTLYVSDQQAGKIYDWPLNKPAPSPGKWPVLASLAKPDLLAAGPDGTVFTGQFEASPDGSPVAVRQIFPDGRVSVVVQAPAVARPSGIAYDAGRRRLFVADRVGDRFGVRIFSVQ